MNVGRSSAKSRSRAAAGSLTHDRMGQTVRLLIMGALLLLGGASRNDAWTQPVAQLLALAACTYVLIMRQGAWVGLGRLVWVPLLGLAALCALQLVPLPPLLWQALPGRELLADVDMAAGLSVWRPLSIHPAATLAALLGMLVPLAAVLLFSDASARDMQQALMLVLGIILFSALLGIMQAGSDGTSLYPYRITNTGAAVGIFANRNHQAVLIALVMPIVAYFVLDYQERRRPMVWALVVAAAVAALAAIVIMFNGSRLGAALFLVGLAGAAALFVGFRPYNNRVTDLLKSGRNPGLFIGGGAAALALFAAGLWWFGDRLDGLARIAETDLDSEGRVRLIPYIWETVQSFMPVGAGVGSFDRAYRMHEPFDQLTLAYLNHAHNDALEILVEGGVLAVGLALVSFWLMTRAAWQAWRSGRDTYDQQAALARLGSIILALLLIGGLTDYPLRTPALAVMASLALIMLARGYGPQNSQNT
jgi:O-antigen ligase